MRSSSSPRRFRNLKRSFIVLRDHTSTLTLSFQNQRRSIKPSITQVLDRLIHSSTPVRRITRPSRSTRFPKTQTCSGHFDHSSTKSFKHSFSRRFLLRFRWLLSFGFVLSFSRRLFDVQLTIFTSLNLEATRFAYSIGNSSRTDRVNEVCLPKVLHPFVYTKTIVVRRTQNAQSCRAILGRTRKGGLLK